MSLVLVTERKGIWVQVGQPRVHPPEKKEIEFGIEIMGLVKDLTDQRVSTI